MQEAEHRALQQPDDFRIIPQGRAEIVKVGSGEVGRSTPEPGSRWSDDVKLIAHTSSREARHFPLPPATTRRRAVHNDRSRSGLNGKGLAWPGK
jgi:hypothetical protein